MSKQAAAVGMRHGTLGGLTNLTETMIRRRSVPDPGVHLRRAVDSVLAELATSAHPDRQAMHRFDDTLRGALAWTAAVGDTCRIAAAVTAVRDARIRLDAGEQDQARVALLNARDGLRLPASRTPIE